MIVIALPARLKSWLPITFALLLSPIALRSQTLRRPLSAPLIGAGVYSSGYNNVFSFTINQGSLAQLKNAAAGIYGERRFLLNELSNYCAALALPTHVGQFGLKAAYSGSAAFNEMQWGLAYARKLDKRVDIGVQFNYNSIKAAGYGGDAAISIEAGTVFHLSEKLHTGFHVANPFGGKFGKQNQEKLASVYNMGFGYEASEKFLFTAEITREEDQPVDISTGLQYRFVPQMLASLGISSTTSSIWFGFGLNLRSFRLDITTSYHPRLGVTPGLALLFHFNAAKAGSK